MLRQPGGSEFQFCPSQVASSMVLSPWDLCLVHVTVVELIHDKNIICPHWLQSEGVRSYHTQRKGLMFLTKKQHTSLFFFQITDS